MGKDGAGHRHLKFQILDPRIRSGLTRHRHLQLRNIWTARRHIGARGPRTQPSGSPVAEHLHCACCSGSGNKSRRQRGGYRRENGNEDSLSHREKKVVLRRSPVLKESDSDAESDTDWYRCDPPGPESCGCATEEHGIDCHDSYCCGRMDPDDTPRSFPIGPHRPRCSQVLAACCSRHSGLLGCARPFHPAGVPPSERMTPPLGRGQSGSPSNPCSLSRSIRGRSRSIFSITCTVWMGSVPVLFLTAMAPWHGHRVLPTRSQLSV